MTIQRTPLLAPRDDQPSFIPIKGIGFLIQNHIILQRSFYFSDYERIKAITIFALATLLGFVSRYPFIKPAVELAKDQTFLKYAFASSSILALGSLSTWSLYGVLQVSAIPNISVDECPSQKNWKTVAKISYFITLAILGISSQFAMAYMAYFYNSRDSSFSDLIWPALVLMADSALPAYSIDLLVREILMKHPKIANFIDFKYGPQTAIIATIKGQLRALINESKRSCLVRKIPREQIITEESTIHSLFNQLASTCETNPRTIHNLTHKTSNYLKTFFPIAVGGYTALAGCILKGRLSYEGSERLTSNLPLKIFIVGLSTLPTVYISFKVSVKSFAHLFEGLFDNCFGVTKQNQTIPDIFYPRSSRAIKVLTVIICAFTFASIAEASKEFFGFNDFWGVFITVGASLELVTLTTYAAVDLINQLSTNLISKIGNKRARKTSQLILDIDKLSQIINQSGENLFIELLKILPLSFWERLCLENETLAYIQPLENQFVQ